LRDADDPWTALDKSDDDASSAGGGSLQFYNPSAVTTENGFSAFLLEKNPVATNLTILKRAVDTLRISPGMVQS
jgi:hypothetical protein